MMGKVCNRQLPWVEATVDQPKAKEYAKISEILASNLNSIDELTLQEIADRLQLYTISNFHFSDNFLCQLWRCEIL